jgi:hypothetical protein
MKAAILLLVLGTLQAAEPESTVWYDSKGKVVLVETPAEKPPEPFIPQWVAREEERRDRALKGDTRHRRSRAGPSSPWGWSYPVVGFGYCTPRHYRCFPSGGVRVIIR